MSFGTLSPAQADLVRQHVAGQRVTDLGAGDLLLSVTMLALGASSIDAVDKSWDVVRDPSCRGHRLIRLHTALFAKCFGPAWDRMLGQPTLLSWPHPRAGPEIVLLVSQAPVIIYLGQNWGGTTCGDPALFNHLRRRKVLGYLPERANTLAIYGELLTRPRKLLGEEAAGCDQQEVWSFEEILQYDHHERDSDPLRLDDPERPAGRGHGDVFDRGLESPRRRPRTPRGSSRPSSG